MFWLKNNQPRQMKKDVLRRTLTFKKCIKCSNEKSRWKWCCL